MQTQDIVAALNRVARSHFDWTVESFVRVLTLAEWGERELSSRIDDEYRREIPRLYRAIERIDELGGRADMALGEPAHYTRHLPRVGRNVPEMIDREHESLGGFQHELRELERAFDTAGEEVGRQLASDASKTRASYLDWLSRNTHAIAAGGRELSPAPENGTQAWHALIRLYALLSPGIEETVVHMLLQNRARQREAASESWRDSWAYMLYAADAVRLLARRGWELDFERDTSRGLLQGIEAPAVATSPGQATDSDKHRRAQLSAALSKLAESLAGSGDAEAESICSGAANYLMARSRGEAGEAPKPAPAFEAMLEREAYKAS